MYGGNHLRCCGGYGSHFQHCVVLARYGDPATFWAKVDTSAECWSWKGRRDSHGYGMLTRHGRHTGAHRVAYELARGPISAGLAIDHLCRNKQCVNPSHLEAVTGAENTLRYARFRWPDACSAGHPYDDTNTYVTTKGWRVCRSCVSEQTWQRRRRRWTATGFVPSQIRLPGHTYPAQGRLPNGDAIGAAVCECGATSGVLTSIRARMRWHQQHKLSLLATADPALAARLDAGDVLDRARDTADAHQMEAQQ